MFYAAPIKIIYVREIYLENFLVGGGENKKRSCEGREGIGIVGWMRERGCKRMC